MAFKNCETCLDKSFCKESSMCFQEECLRIKEQLIQDLEAIYHNTSGIQNTSFSSDLKKARDSTQYLHRSQLHKKGASTGFIQSFTKLIQVFVDKYVKDIEQINHIIRDINITLHKGLYKIQRLDLEFEGKNIEETISLFVEAYKVKQPES